MVVISSIKQISPDCVQVTLSAGSCFFIRLSYLRYVPHDKIDVGIELSDVDLEDITASGFAYSAEKAALLYLNRSEHSRFLLTQKLKRKGHEKQAIEQALDYLESCDYLSDSRYAEAWLRNRFINHAEGKQKLLVELCSRGIERKLAEEKISDFLDSVGEDKILSRAVEKCKRLGKSDLDIEKYLQRKGFSISQIRNYLQSN